MPTLEELKESELLIMDFIAPAELHLMLGVVNLFYILMKGMWKAMVEEWAKNSLARRSVYHGGNFEGNQCRQLLNNIRFFEDSHGNPKIPAMAPYLDTLKKFNIIREKCFSSKPVGDFDYHKAFDDFKASFLVVHSDFEYLEETASLIPKVHELFFHVTSFHG